MCFIMQIVDLRNGEEEKWRELHGESFSDHKISERIIVGCGVVWFCVHTGNVLNCTIYSDSLELNAQKIVCQKVKTLQKKDTYAEELFGARSLTFARDALVVQKRQEEPIRAAQSGLSLQIRSKQCFGWWLKATGYMYNKQREKHTNSATRLRTSVPLETRAPSTRAGRQRLHALRVPRRAWGRCTCRSRFSGPPSSRPLGREWALLPEKARFLLSHNKISKIYHISGY